MTEAKLSIGYHTYNIVHLYYYTVVDDYTYIKYMSTSHWRFVELVFSY
jgi:hypothetical protein